jgi:hypothetical protein
MTKAELFYEWAISQGAHVEVTQEDDGSGYTVFVVTVAHPSTGGPVTFDVTINE